jgi:hypothetical protein
MSQNLNLKKILLIISKYEMTRNEFNETYVKMYNKNYKNVSEKEVKT